jgi:membrane protein YqaA with SNARE-associated domain
MHRLSVWVQASAVALGGPGLFLIAFFDSSFLSFPLGVDLLIIGLVTAHTERMLYYALMPTLGSMAGCFALYIVGRKGGEAFLRRRFADSHVDGALAVFRKYGVLAVAVPSLLPPPAPFKPFVLAAGVAGVRPLDFLIAVGIGRGIRYFGEALLAVWYGERAAQFVRHNARPVSLGLAVAVLVFGVCWIWYRKRRQPGFIDGGL